MQYAFNNGVHRDASKLISFKHGILVETLLISAVWYHTILTTASTTTTKSGIGCSYRGRGQFDPGAGRKLLSKEPRFTSTSTYPDATDWTIGDVADFLISAGFSEQAEVFREQVIFYYPSCLCSVEKKEKERGRECLCSYNLTSNTTKIKQNHQLKMLLNCDCFQNIFD